MPKDISIKEFRAHLATYADRVEDGEMFRVIRHSKPSFILMKVDPDAATSEQEWETIIDFTDAGESHGVALKDVLKTLRKINR